jgi:uncharacterized membrane protein
MRTLVSLTATLTTCLLCGCQVDQLFETPQTNRPVFAKQPSSSQFATLITLPALSNRSPSEAIAVNRLGTVVAGYAWEPKGTLRAVKWTLQVDGSWAIAVLPLATAATGAVARAVNDAGDVGGNDFPITNPHPMLWPAGGGFNMLGCDDSGEVYSMTAGAQVLVGVHRVSGTATPALWRPGSCREDLPSLTPGGEAFATAVSADGTIVGGGVGFPLRWTRVGGVWNVEQLDQRTGMVSAANAAGDLAGRVSVSCAQSSGCLRAVIWYANGTVRELGTLGGADGWARGINASGEVVGSSTPSVGTNTGFFWSESSGIVALPIKGKWAAANAISDVRQDGTRLVVGTDSQGDPIAWVVRNP